jgi:hypothetical protein
VAEAAPPPITAPAPQPAKPQEVQVASLAPAASPPKAAPKLESEPRLVRRPTRATPPSEAERGRLNELVTLASLTTPDVSFRRPPEADRNKLQQLVTASIAAAPSPEPAPEAREASRTAPRLAALGPEAAGAPRASLAEPGATDWNSGWAPAPEFDEDHPEELSYRPFPVAPLLTQSASVDDTALVKIHHPDVARTLDMLDGEVVLPLRLRVGRQVAQVMWAQQFRGDAVDLSVLEDAERSGSAPQSLTSHTVKTTTR